MTFEGEFEFDSETVRASLYPESDWCIGIKVLIEVRVTSSRSDLELESWKIVGVKTCDLGKDLFEFYKTSEALKLELKDAAEQAACELFSSLNEDDFYEGPDKNED